MFLILFAREPVEYCSLDTTQDLVGTKPCQFTLPELADLKEGLPTPLGDRSASI